MKSMKLQNGHFFPWHVCGIAMTVISFNASPAQLDLSDNPLFLSSNVEPNLVMTLDDSLSMMRGYAPEAVDNTLAALNGPRFKSSFYNSLYYNPNLKYTIPSRSDGTTYSTSFSNAYFNGFDTSKGYTDLNSHYRVVAQSMPNQVLSSACFNSGSPRWIAANNNDYSNCLFAKNPADVAVSTTCNITFKHQSGYDELDLATACSPTITTTNKPATGSTITVSGTGTYNSTTKPNGRDGTYTVTSTSTSGTKYAKISEQLPSLTTTSTVTQNATLSWSYTDSSIQTGEVGAYYYLFYTQKPATAKPSGCDDNKATDACYVKIVVGSADDIFDGTTSEKQQNFANWYSFHRTRAMATMSASINAVNGLLDETVRLGWQTLNTTGCNSFGTSCKGYDGTNRENRIKALTSSHKSNFYNWAQRFSLSGSTPLPAGLKRVGDYFKTNGKDSPYAEKPYEDLGTELACRRNFHVMFTDGLWNDATTGFGDVDSSDTSLSLPDGKTYTKQAPYQDVNTPAGSTYSNSNSLADIALYYWATDLRAGTTTGLANKVTPSLPDQTGTDTEQYWNPKNDPATWQHLVNFTIGLGLSNSFNSACYYDPDGSTLTKDPNNPTPGCPVWGGSTFEGDYAALKAGTKNWPRINPNPTYGHEPDGHVYDLWHTAINSRGKFFSAEDPVALNDAFSSIFSTIISANSSSAAAAANSTSIQSGTVLYQAQFSSRNWSGHLYNFTVTADGTIADKNGDKKLDGIDANWDAATKIPAHGSRNIVTLNDQTALGTQFIWNNISLNQQNALRTSSSGVFGSVTLGQDRLNWLRGDYSKEVRFPSGIFRNRPIDTSVTNVLGDIINSDPIFTQTEDFGYSDLPASAPEKSLYTNFVTGKSSRPPMVYVGANDGMIHGFRADTAHADKGKELFAYVPAAVYGHLSSLTETNYSHKYFVDGSPNVGDAYITKGTTSAWGTVLLGGLGKGGKAIYALNISDPYSYGTSATPGDNVLWEYSGSSDSSTADNPATTVVEDFNVTDRDGMGYTYSQPQIARLHNGKWAAIFSNGYNSSAEKAFLYIVDISTGTLIEKLSTNSADSNGLSTPRLYDSNNDKIIDYVYAGDLQGNLWKFDLTSSTSSDWKISNDAPLFTAKNSANQIQPITAQPTIGGHANGGVLVYFGTGRYLTNGDVTNTEVQSFYAIWDKPDSTSTVTRNNLVKQNITAESSVTSTSTISGCVDNTLTTENECEVSVKYDVRETSKNTVDYATKFGWYMDLLPSSNSAQGERVISSALLKYDRIIFLTAIPSSDPCAPGGESWLMELDAKTGAATEISSFDFNGDDKFDDTDKLPNGNTVSGVHSNVGMVKATVWLEKEGTGTAVKEMSGTTSNIMSLKNRGGSVSSGTVEKLYWLQLQ